MTLVSQASHTCGTELNFSDIEELLGQKSGCGNYIGRGSAARIGRLAIVSDSVIGDVPWEYIHLSFIIFVGAQCLGY